ncbi:hypothetical protein PI172_1966 [Prevotella intermedia]|uniref:Uncharacterized protein n=1 Tax=Prevotella intermedia TaxID=28131 RepID=A0AAD1F7X4_PREIN|nr:hypothetical protein PI172_1966 [Prevotella intermedia]
MLPTCRLWNELFPPETRGAGGVGVVEMDNEVSAKPLFQVMNFTTNSHILNRKTKKN